MIVPKLSDKISVTQVSEFLGLHLQFQLRLNSKYLNKKWAKLEPFIEDFRLSAFIDQDRDQTKIFIGLE